MSNQKERELEMEFEQDLAFFREQFEPIKETIKTPQSLSAQALLSQLDGIDLDALDEGDVSFDENECALIDEGNVVSFPKKKRIYQIAGSIAACLVCVIGVVYLQSAQNAASRLEFVPQDAPPETASFSLAIEEEADEDEPVEAYDDSAQDNPLSSGGDMSSQAQSAPENNGSSNPEQPVNSQQAADPAPASSPTASPQPESSQPKVESIGLPTGSGRTKSESDSGSTGGTPAGRTASDDAVGTAQDADSSGTQESADADSSAAIAKDYTEIRDKISALQNQSGYFANRAYDGWAIEEDAVMESSAADMAPAATGGSGEMGGGGDGGAMKAAPEVSAAAADVGGYSTTNVQETGVDEADIVKTDGTYLYSYVYKNSTSKGPVIFIADAQGMSVASKIELSQGIQEFYISGDYLVTVGYEYIDSNVLPKTTIAQGTENDLLREMGDRSASIDFVEKSANPAIYPPVYPSDPVMPMRTTVQATVYDISNRTAPKQVHTYAQDGDYTSSRMIGGTLYLVSTHYVWTNVTNPDAYLCDIVPAVYTNGSARLISPDCIAIAPRIQSTTYAVVSALDVVSGTADSQAILGAAEGIYMSGNNLYLYYSGYRYSILQRQSFEETNIVKYAVSGSKLTLRQTVSVPGYVDGQFAFSESKGNLRVATTSYKNYQTQNNVYVLGPTLNIIGRLEGLAPDERIYSVRYVGDMAYLVTFRQVDPLFAIDLSNPSDPKLLGQLKIPGFSEYLHPLDEHTLLGIGQSADMYGFTEGLKLSLFDVSDPLNPKETAVYNLGGPGSYSEALSNHRAVMFNESRNLIAFPASLSGSGDMPSQQGYFIFSYDRDKGFALETTINLSESDPNNYFLKVDRGQYIGEVLYAFSPDKIASFSLESFDPLGEISLIG